MSCTCYDRSSEYHRALYRMFATRTELNSMSNSLRGLGKTIELKNPKGFDLLAATEYASDNLALVAQDVDNMLSGGSFCDLPNHCVLTKSALEGVLSAVDAYDKVGGDTSLWMRVLKASRILGVERLLDDCCSVCSMADNMDADSFGALVCQVSDMTLNGATYRPDSFKRRRHRGYYESIGIGGSNYRDHE